MGNINFFSEFGRDLGIEISKSADKLDMSQELVVLLTRNKIGMN